MLSAIELAEILLETNAETGSLLAENPQIAPLEIARELRRKCYAAWTSEPQRTANIARALANLAAVADAPEIAALSLWANGIAGIVAGELEKAAAELKRAAEIFQENNQMPDAAQIGVARLYALALLGRYDEAIGIGKRALAVFLDNEDQFSAGKIEKNLGNLHDRINDYPAAQQFFESAARRFADLREVEQLAMAENGLAINRALQNDFRAAEKFYAAALERARGARMFVTEAEIEASLGNLALFRGRYDEALKFLEQSRDKYAELGMPHQAALADLELADVYLELNLLPEAAAIYERVAPRFGDFKMRAEEARTLAALGELRMRTLDFDSARDALRRAGELYELEKNDFGAATVKLIRGNLDLRENRFDAAREAAEAAGKVFQAANSPRQFLWADFLRGEAERNLQNSTVAAEIYRTILQNAGVADQPQIAWLCENALGVLLKSTHPTAAETHFKRAVEIIETLRSPLAADEFRRTFFADKLAPCSNLADICRRSERVPEAFGWLERARSQALLDLLDAPVVPAANAAGTQKLNAKLDRLREELNWFYSRLSRPSGGGVAAAREEIEIWRGEIRRLENEINALVLQIEARTAKRDATATHFDFESLRASLGDERILLEFCEFDGAFAAFVVTADGVRLFENLGTAAEVNSDLEQIHFQFGALRYGAENVRRHLPQMTRRVRRHLQNLYDRLLRPLENAFTDKHLIVVPAKNLHYVPFQALHDGRRYVVERQTISLAPSAAVLQNLLARKAARVEKICGVGFADERVPQVENEIKMIADIAPQTVALTGERATLAALRENFARGNFDAAHLACHGQFRAENPLFSALHLADGWLTVRDAARLDLANALVVLSACETGLSEIAAGEELLGLARGFFAAGASSLVLSLWTVNDASTALLMSEFYRQLRTGVSPSESLRRAQLEFVSQNAHPYFWSPFVLTGKW